LSIDPNSININRDFISSGFIVHSKKKIVENHFYLWCFPQHTQHQLHFFFVHHVPMAKAKRSDEKDVYHENKSKPSIQINFMFPLLFFYPYHMDEKKCNNNNTHAICVYAIIIVRNGTSLFPCRQSI
jgi:hypothetical protein